MLAAAASPQLCAQSGIVQIFVVEGENNVFSASGTSPRPFVVRVTDETGAPLSGIAVSFRLPEDGVSGEFASGLRTDLAVTGVDGRAGCPMVRWGAFAGPGRLRVTASHGTARAGMLVPYYLSADAGLGGSIESIRTVVAGSAVASAVQPIRILDTPSPKVKKKRRWVRLVTTVAAVVGGGVALDLVRRGAGNTRTASVPGVPVSIGVPTIRIGGVR